MLSLKLLEKFKNHQVITALKTPYNKEGKIDYIKLDNLISRQINNGINGLIIAGTTGEGHLMEPEDLINLIKYIVNSYGNVITIIGNTSSNSTSKMKKLTILSFEAGMHASIQVNPYYGKTSTQGLELHFNIALEQGPTIIYNVPHRTAQDINTEFVLNMSKHPNFLGIKECAGINRIKEYVSAGVMVWSGNDEEGQECVNAGGIGLMSTASNIVPLLTRLWVSGSNDYTEVLGLLFKLISIESNPIVINTLMAMSNLILPVFKLPYYPLNYNQRLIAKEVLYKCLKFEKFTTSILELEDQDFIIL